MSMEDAKLYTRCWLRGGRAFCVELEQGFWDALEEIAESYDVSVTALVMRVRRESPADLESALRVFAIEHLRALESSLSEQSRTARLQ